RQGEGFLRPGRPAGEPDPPDLLANGRPGGRLRRRSVRHDRHHGRHLHHGGQGRAEDDRRRLRRASGLPPRGAGRQPAPVRGPADLAGRRIAITAVGSGSHNQLARLARKYGFKYEDMQLLPLQTLVNEMSAVKGGQVDATPVPATLAKELEDSGAGKIIAWMGDEVPTQFGGLFATPATIEKHRGLVARFVRAYVRAIQYYDQAFQRRGPD